MNFFFAIFDLNENQIFILSNKITSREKLAQSFFSICVKISLGKIILSRLKHIHIINDNRLVYLMLAKLNKYIHIINENKQVYLILAKLVSIAPP